ncbi:MULTISPECIES: hydratase [unclassified Bradyrhizobium]|uniref:2-keto-4-pentenoate hydratase n=1 Tax=unclassified Bradyrhizobium TaxID=2631580 RepID=UPI00247AFC80|nr:MULTISPECIES: hydratase [unclassified Bradyrhizobium]WGS19887.1 hydratase [Bradyrhizobium sp. ISRA463]WGS26741.1 hydratase [Bradyrhizobium sp. ISRA464]
MKYEAERELTDLLYSLRKEARQQSGLRPDLVPLDQASAYRIASAVADRLGWEIGGWKVAAMKEELQKALRATTPIYGRIFHPCVMQSPAIVRFSELCSPIVEVEYQIKVGRNLLPREQPYTQDHLAEAIASIHPGIELAGCSFSNDDAFPPVNAMIADGSGGRSIVIGDPIPDWERSGLADQSVSLSCNGLEKRRGTASAAIDHPIVSFTWLINELSKVGIGLYAGQFVSTGTVCGMLAARTGGRYTADYGRFGTVELRLE